MDIERDDYGANKKIIENGITGLKECVELKNNNNFNSEIFTLTTKESYPEFEAIVEGKEKVLVLNS